MNYLCNTSISSIVAVIILIDSLNTVISGLGGNSFRQLLDPCLDPSGSNRFLAVFMTRALWLIHSRPGISQGILLLVVSYWHFLRYVLQCWQKWKLRQLAKHSSLLGLQNVIPGQPRILWHRHLDILRGILCLGHKDSSIKTCQLMFIRFSWISRPSFIIMCVSVLVGQLPNLCTYGL